MLIPKRKQITEGTICLKKKKAESRRFNLMKHWGFEM